MLEVEIKNSHWYLTLTMSQLLMFILYSIGIISIIRAASNAVVENNNSYCV